MVDWFAKLAGTVFVNREQRAQAGQTVERAHDTILRCRMNAAFRSQVERRIYAAEGVPEEICPAPQWSCFCFINLTADQQPANVESMNPRGFPNGYRTASFHVSGYAPTRLVLTNPIAARATRQPS